MPGHEQGPRRSVSGHRYFHKHFRGIDAVGRASYGLEPLEPRLLLSATMPDQPLVEPMSASGAEVVAESIDVDVIYQEQTQYDNFFQPNTITMVN